MAKIADGKIVSYFLCQKDEFHFVILCANANLKEKTFINNLTAHV